MNNTVKESLERIRAEAIRKAREGIAGKRSSVGNTQAIDGVVSKLQEGFQGEVASEVSRKLCRRLVDNFLSIFQETLDELRHGVTSKSKFPKAARNNRNEIMLYPEGCRFMYTNGSGHGVVVVEQPPQVRTILVGHGQKHIPLPYVVFVVHYNQRGSAGNATFNYGSLLTGFRNSPLKTIQDRLYYPALPNFNAHGVCMGSYEGVIGGDTPARVAEDVFGTFWQSVFGNGFHPFTLGSKSIGDWPAWEKVAEGNPLNILKAEWRQGQLLEQLIRQADETKNVTDAQVNDLVQFTWNRAVADMDTETVQMLVKGAAQEILTQLLVDLALQPQKT